MKIHNKLARNSILYAKYKSKLLDRFFFVFSDFKKRTTSQKKKTHKMAHFRLAKKCIAFFATICILPVILVLLVTTDQYMRPQQQRHLLEVRCNTPLKTPCISYGPFSF